MEQFIGTKKLSVENVKAFAEVLRHAEHCCCDVDYRPNGLLQQALKAADCSSRCLEFKTTVSWNDEEATVYNSNTRTEKVLYSAIPIAPKSETIEDFERAVTNYWSLLDSCRGCGPRTDQVIQKAHDDVKVAFSKLNSEEQSSRNVPVLLSAEDDGTGGALTGIVMASRKKGCATQ